MSKTFLHFAAYISEFENCGQSNQAQLTHDLGNRVDKRSNLIFLDK